ncbi:MAG: sodium:proton antiporter, partial [Polyangiaceae bacterium]
MCPNYTRKRGEYALLLIKAQRSDDAMSPQQLPTWTTLPFPALVFAIAVLPIAVPTWWERRWFQGLVVGLCAIPVMAHFAWAGQLSPLKEAGQSYVSFVATLGALYITSGGVQLSGDIEAKPSTNVALVLFGSVLAS